MTSFKDLGLSPTLLGVLDVEGYHTPTPIQAQAIPHVLTGKDILGIAQTGTGKTAAFSLPILHRLAANPAARRRKAARVLILAPTRELASQIADNVAIYGSGQKVSVVTVFGGVPIGRQERAVSGGVDIVVATPGRLLDLVERNALDISGIEVLVLDEADQMLDLGFIHALKAIVRLVPQRRQTLFFSATMPPAISNLAQRFLHNPVKVAVTPVASTVDRIEQRAIFLPGAAKVAVLTHLLRDPAMARTLVFTRTKHGADKVVKKLGQSGIMADAIHGNRSQPQRERALDGFKRGTIRVLVATDIAARGIDVDGVSHVVNYELPNVPESYVHRIGRTARAGAAGIAIALVADEERSYLRQIEKLTGQKVPVVGPPEGFDLDSAPRGRDEEMVDRPRGPFGHRPPREHPKPAGHRGQPRGRQRKRRAA